MGEMTIDDGSKHNAGSQARVVVYELVQSRHCIRAQQWSFKLSPPCDHDSASLAPFQDYAISKTMKHKWNENKNILTLWWLWKPQVASNENLQFVWIVEDKLEVIVWQPYTMVCKLI